MTAARRGLILFPGLKLIEFAEGAVDNDSRAEFLGVSMRDAARSAWSRSLWCSPHVWSRGRSRGRRWADGRIAGWENDADNEAESRQ